ncbi:hypothetical protein [Lentzea albidocapillata]|uniref:hypothetical protein n=1 Tax=Lentzea albidocapillata TaxID=40571 RepID=UPI000B7EC4FE|nr:hypothetical protein [Lentzea albidocapillata]
MAHVGMLCFKILEHLDSMSSNRHSIRFAPGNHLTLVVADVFIAEPSEIEVVIEAENYAFALEEFNWDNQLNPYDRRFHLCQVMILGPAASQAMEQSGVVMQATTVTCPSCKSPGPVSGR